MNKKEMKAYPHYIYDGINSKLAHDWIPYFYTLFIISVGLTIATLIFHCPYIALYLSLGMVVANAVIIVVLLYEIKEVEK